MSILAKKYFRDEAAAFRHLEALLWPEGPVCPHCGVVGKAGRLEGVRSKPSKKSPQGALRYGLWKCYSKECRKQFTVRVKTIFDRSPLITSFRASKEKPWRHPRLKARNKQP